MGLNRTDKVYLLYVFHFDYTSFVSQFGSGTQSWVHIALADNLLRVSVVNQNSTISTPLDRPCAQNVSTLICHSY